MLAGLAADLREEARRSNERRAIVLHGQRDACYAALESVVDGADLPMAETTVVGHRDLLDCDRVTPRNADQLLGTTRTAVVLDWHDTCLPNAVGQLVGVVDGGGLLVITAPSLDAWPADGDAFHESLATPAATVGEVGHRYHDRVASLLDAHRGIAVVDVDTDRVESRGLTDPPPRRRHPNPDPPTDAAYPAAAYDACRTGDQVEVLAAFEALRDEGNAVVVEADRGRGKSSVAGLAAASLAADGDQVLVTAPTRGGITPLFERVRELLDTLDCVADVDGMDIQSRHGGGVRYRPPDSIDDPGTVDVLLVDEAAGLPVAQLTSFLDCDRVAFITTVHGYEGSGRGFAVRFRDHLVDSHHAVTDTSLATPIRYAESDPIEVWAFHTLLLDASPAADPLVEDTTPDTVQVEFISQDTLADDDRLLGEAFGLLVTAHYRTEPNDLARLLDAPNISVCALTANDHVVSVALLATEGGLDTATREEMYDGTRVRGNMLPDVFASQLRDPDAAATIGWRVLRIATHPVARSRGLGSRLLEAITETARTRDHDWVGVAYGATPRLVSFWADNGFSTVHFSTTRSDASGEHSALMMTPLTQAGEAVHDRLASWFCRRIPGVLGDALRSADPDVVRAVLDATRVAWDPELSEREWRVVAGAAFGPGQYAVDPAPFQRLAITYFTSDCSELTDREERLVVMKVLQSRPGTDVTDTLEYHSSGECLRALGDAYATLCREFGGSVAAAVRDRYE